MRRKRSAVAIPAMIWALRFEMTEMRKMTMQEAYIFAEETEGLAYALEILISEEAGTNHTHGRTALGAVSSLLSARCKRIGEALDGGITLPPLGV